MKYLSLIFVLLFTACSFKNYEVTKSKVILIKSPKLKFSDLGYIRNSDKSIELELFIAGKVIQRITINNFICTNDGCLTKSGFNEEYLSKFYPEDILQNIFLARPIYESKNKIVTKDGFKQYIKDKYVDIKYIVNSKVTFFKDKKNKIIFKIKDIDG